MTPAHIDIFSNVHKGIRAALFDACSALGRAEASAGDAPARAVLRDALRFVAHHGENEDLLLLPLLEQRAPELFERLQSEHATMAAALRELEAALETASTHALYLQATAFTALYLQHMYTEEHELEPRVRSRLSNEELASVGRRSVERTAPADQRMMLGRMLPALPPSAAAALLEALPAPAAAALRHLVTTNAPAPARD